MTMPITPRDCKVAPAIGAHRLVTFGEIMLRLSPPGHGRFVQANCFDATFGGGEANVAVSLAQLGMETCFVTKLPTHQLGQAAVNHLRRFGVDTRHIVRGGDRLGVYYLEHGASQRPSTVIYDRAFSALTTLAPEELDLDAVFEGATWFHFTGITPALGVGPRKTLEHLLGGARRAGARVSCDLNYRSKLWTPRQAQAVMRPLMEQVEVCVANEEDAQHCLGEAIGGSDVASGRLAETDYAELAKGLRRAYGFATVAITLRESQSASRNGWSAMLLDDGDCREPTRSKRYDIQLVDRVGAGDAFCAALILGLLTEESSRLALELAVAASCLKQTIPGDSNLIDMEEARRLQGGEASGRVRR